MEVLEWLRQHCPNVPMVFASSAAVYGDGHDGPIPETAKTVPYSPYGVHKAAVEMLCRSYSENFGLTIAIVRLFSVYGSGLHKQLIYDLCARLSKSSGELQLGGTGKELRDFIHVDDAAKLLVQAIGWASTETPVVNGGTGQAISVSDVAHQSCAAWGATTEISFSGQSRPGDPFSLVADIEAAKRRGFNPAINFATGIKSTVAEYAKLFGR